MLSTIYLRCGLIVLVALAFFSCSNENIFEPGHSKSTISLQVQIDETDLSIGRAGLQKPVAVQRVTVLVTGDDMDDVSTELSGSNTSFSGTLEIPKGDNRTFTIEAFDSGNIKQYEGETTENIKADDETVDLTLSALVPNPVTLGIYDYYSDYVTLTWSRNNDNDFSYYRILRSTSSGLDLNQHGIIDIDDRSVTTYTDYDVQPNTTYYYQVWVVDTERWGKASNTESVLTDEFYIIIDSQITDVWVDFDVFEADNTGTTKKGMKIHVEFTIEGHKDRTGNAACWFYDWTTDSALMDTNNRYGTNSGQVAVSKEFTPLYDNTIFNDLALFMPYEELHLSSGTHYLYYTTGLFDAQGNLVAYLDDDEDQEFTITMNAAKIIVKPARHHK